MIKKGAAEESAQWSMFLTQKMQSPHFICLN